MLTHKLNCTSVVDYKLEQVKRNEITQDLYSWKSLKQESRLYGFCSEFLLSENNVNLFKFGKEICRAGTEVFTD
jgi:hypothetical protein